MSEKSPSEVKGVINVLLVEDHALTRIGLKTAFKRTTDIIVIGEAANGEEAVLQTRALMPDVVVMDVGMPIMDGIQAARQIISEFPQMKIIMLTQHDNDSDILASLAAGASGYCLKDVEPERLYTAVRSVREGDAWLDASIASRVLRHYANLTAESSAGTGDSSGDENGDALPHDGAPGAGAGPAVDRPAQAGLTNANHLEHSPALAVDDESVPEVMDRPAPEALSPRELEVLKLIVAGLSNQEIADKLFISLATAKTHVRNILNKLAVDDRTQAAVHAMRRRLV
jgi:two-component system, NarL family, response regulator LiaR